MDGPVFDKLEDARNWCVHAMVSHFDRRLGMSDASIEPFKGLVNRFAEPSGQLVYQTIGSAKGSHCMFSPSYLRNNKTTLRQGASTTA
jgi:hypothetical protein